MVLPNYRNNIVNVSSSILESFDVKPLYAPIHKLKNLKSYENVILLIIDGLGNEYLKKYGKGSFLQKHFIKTITSTFPSTTSAATTTLETGVAPLQHGVTGWFMFLKEQGIIFAPWSFQPRIPNTKIKIKRNEVFLENRINDKIKSPSFLIYGKEMGDREVNRYYDKLKTYTDFDDMFKKIIESMNSSNKRKYIFSHYGGFDNICHDKGCASIETKNLFLELDKKISAFADLIKNTNTTIIITSDHGQIDSNQSKAIELENHPKLQETLIRPLCGEHRFAYCYVRRNKIKQFENYAKTKLKFCCNCYKSSVLIEKNFFGLFKPNKELKERIGDYVLIAKENYTFKDWLPHEKKFYLTGVHGGLSKEEMLVPLIWIRNK